MGGMAARQAVRPLEIQGRQHLAADDAGREPRRVFLEEPQHGAARLAELGEVVAANAAPVKTTLTVSVPADAKITLAGIETKQTGEVREFATDKLAAGQTWSNYTVRVEVTRDGKTMSQDRTIMLSGGQSQELSFDLGGMQLASKN